MTFDVPTQVTFNLKGNCLNHGRTDAGAARLETMLSSHLGCTNVILNMQAEEKSLRIDELSMALTADMDTNGISIQAPRHCRSPR